jgi:DNA polymerase III sliding clamp (beta) subunit (PCNA family)
MNFNIQKIELLEALKPLSKIASDSNPLPELRGFLLEADEDAGELTVTASDMETMAKVTPFGSEQGERRMKKILRPP